MWQQRDPTLRITSKNNLIVRNLKKDLTTQELQALFSGSGNIISAKISKNAKGGSEGFGFVQFSTEEECKKAIDNFKSKEFSLKYAQEGKDLLVDLFEKSEIRHKNETYNNLYVKNIPEAWTNEQLQEFFTKFGAVTSAKVEIGPNGVSKCFGYVCFNEVDDAKKAEEECNEKEVEGKTLTVCKFLKKTDRQKAMRKASDKSKNKSEQHNNNL